MTAPPKANELNTELVLERLAGARAGMSGDFVSVSRVVDTLLDLRLLCGMGAEDVAEIDTIMTSIPGRSVAANEWWLEQLHRLEHRLVPSDGERPPMTAS